MTSPAALSEAEVLEFQKAHPQWRRDQGALVRSYEAATFLEGIAFVQRVAELAEAADHHPDIDVRWRKVTLRFITHDAGHAVTVLDTRLAGECDALFASTQPAVVSPGP